MRLLRPLLAAALLACAAASAFAADYPARAVRIISPYAAGGGGDALTRTLANKLSARWHQPVIVDNRPGAGSTVGTAAAAQAPGDGYTLLLTGGTLTVSAALYPKLPYDPVKDLVPITLVASSPFLLTTRADLGVNSVSELVALARSRPGKLNFGSSGNGTMAHLAGEFLRQSANIDVVHVPFRGGSPAFQALLAGQIDYLFDVPPEAIPQVAAGKIKALGVTSPTRLPALPDVPTIAESGMPGFDVQIWFGLLAPRGTPDSVVQEVREATLAALRDEQVLKTLAAQGMFPRTSTPAEFASLIRAELPKWSDVVRRANLKPE